MIEDDFINIANEYDIRYRIGNPLKRGHISFKRKKIYINPIFNEDGMTFTHEIFHHYYSEVVCVDVSESEIENNAMEFYKKHKRMIDGFTKFKLRNKKNI